METVSNEVLYLYIVVVCLLIIGTFTAWTNTHLERTKAKNLKKRNPSRPTAAEVK